MPRRRTCTISTRRSKKKRGRRKMEKRRSEKKWMLDERNGGLGSQMTKVGFGATAGQEKEESILEEC